MTIADWIALAGVALVAGSFTVAGLVWALRVESRVKEQNGELIGRLNVQDERHRALASIVDGIKRDVHEGIVEIRSDMKETRIEMQLAIRELRELVSVDGLYIKQRVDKLSKAAGDPPLQRQNRDDQHHD